MLNLLGIYQWLRQGDKCDNPCSQLSHTGLLFYVKCLFSSLNDFAIYGVLFV